MVRSNLTIQWAFVYRPSEENILRRSHTNEALEESQYHNVYNVKSWITPTLKFFLLFPANHFFQLMRYSLERMNLWKVDNSIISIFTIAICISPSKFACKPESYSTDSNSSALNAATVFISVSYVHYQGQKTFYLLILWLRERCWEVGFFYVYEVFFSLSVTFWGSHALCCLCCQCANNP